MKFFTASSFVMTLFAAAFAAPSPAGAPTPSPVTISYDQTYDNANGDLNSVACSNGQYGLLTKGYTTFGSLPGFANIGGAGVVAGWNSNACGSCWKLTYNGNSIYVLAIDHSAAGTFNIALSAMNTLTNGQAVDLGRVSATAESALDSACGLKD